MKRRFDPFTLAAELLGLASIVLIAYGLHSIYPPAMWLFLGIVCGIPYIAGTLNTLAQPGQEMTLIGRLIRASAAPDPTNDFWYTDPQTGFAYMPGGGGSAEAAMRNSAVFDCVRLLSEDVAKLPLILYRRMPDGGKERATEHPLYSRLKTEPNGWQTSFEFRQLMQAQLELRGNAYARIISGRGPVEGLEPIDPDSVANVYRNVSGTVIYEVRREKDRMPEKLTQDQVFHLRGFSLDGLKGLSTIGLHSETIGLGLSAQQFQASSFKNGIRLSGVFLHPNTLGKEAKLNLRETISKKFQGTGKAGGFMILEEGMQWKEMSMTMQDAQFLELRKLNRAEIAAIFRVPPHKIGDLDRATFSNIEHQALEYVTDALMSRLVRWEQAIYRDLIFELNGEGKETYFAEFLVDSLLRGDLKSRYDAYAVGINAGILSPNEARSFENLNAREGGDRYLQPLNMTTSGNQDQQRAVRVLRLESLKLANKELVAFRKASARFEGRELVEWAEEFYRGYRESLCESLQLPREKVDRYCDGSLNELKAAGSINEMICGWETEHAERLVGLALAA